MCCQSKRELQARKKFILRRMTQNWKQLTMGYRIDSKKKRKGNSPNQFTIQISSDLMKSRVDIKLLARDSSALCRRCTPHKIMSANYHSCNIAWQQKEKWCTQYYPSEQTARKYCKVTTEKKILEDIRRNQKKNNILEEEEEDIIRRRRRIYQKKKNILEEEKKKILEDDIRKR